MHRIDTGTRDEDEFGTGKDGFTGGDPGAGISPTDFSPDWCDDIQETLAQFIEGQGVTLAKRVFTQLTDAVNARLRLAALQNWESIASVLSGAINAVEGDGSGDLSAVNNERVWVAVGDGGDAASSNDGKSWSAETTGTAQNLNDIATDGAGLFVAVGSGGTILTRSFAGTWTSRTSGVSATLTAVAYDPINGEWIAVGSSGTVVTSPDGTTWTDRTPASGTTETLNGVDTDGAGGAKACGDNGTIIRSADGGASWSADTSNSTDDLSDIHHSEGEGHWLSVGQNSGDVLKVDTGGTTWSVVSDNLSGTITALATDRGSLWVAVDGGGRLRYSKDQGATWHDVGWSGGSNDPHFALGIWFADDFSTGNLLRSLSV